jgi:hypothetical protein
MAQPVDNVESRLDKLNKQSRQRMQEGVTQAPFVPHTAIQTSEEFDPAMQQILDEANRVPQPGKRK